MNRMPVAGLFAIGILVSGLATLDMRDANAQHSRVYLTTSVGIIRNLETYSKRPHYSIYPELQINTTLINDLLGPFALEGGAFVGGWRERDHSIRLLGGCGIDERRGYNCGFARDSHSGLLVGTRLSLVLRKAPVYLFGLVGLTRQYEWTKWKWVESEEGYISSGTTRHSFNSFETGLRLQLSLFRQLLLGAGVQVYWTLSESRHDIDPRKAYVLSLSFVCL